MQSGAKDYSEANPLPISVVSDWGTNAADGVSGEIAVHKFGYNEVGTGGADISFGVAAIPWLTVGEPLRIRAGGNANDAAAGTGAQEVTIQGLDDSGAIITETVATAGAAQSLPTSASFRRDFRAYVGSVGTYTGSNAGDIEIETTSGTLVLVIPAGFGQTFTAEFSIPADYDGYLRAALVRVEGNKSATVTLWQRSSGSTVGTGQQAKRALRRAIELSGALMERYDPPIRLNPDTDLWASAATSAGTANVEVSFDVVLRPVT